MSLYKAKARYDYKEYSKVEGSGVIFIGFLNASLNNSTWVSLFKTFSAYLIVVTVARIRPHNLKLHKPTP